MDKKEFNQKIRKNGTLLVGYTFIKSLGIVPGIVLERLITEYNYAERHNLLIKRRCFNYEIEEIADSLGLEVSEIEEAITKLIELELIKVKKIERFNLISLNMYTIIEFEKKEASNSNQWDFALQNIQYTAFKEFSYNINYDEQIEKAFSSDIIHCLVNRHRS